MSRQAQKESYWSAIIEREGLDGLDCRIGRYGVFWEQRYAKTWGAARAWVADWWQRL